MLHHLSWCQICPCRVCPKSFASCALVPNALQGLPKKLCYIQTPSVNFNGEGLRRFLVHNAQETPECLRAILPVRRNLLEFLPNCCALLVVGQPAVMITHDVTFSPSLHDLHSPHLPTPPHPTRPQVLSVMIT